MLPIDPNDDSSVEIRPMQKGNAKEYVTYMNMVGGESEFLSFGAGEYKRDVTEVEEMIAIAACQANHLFLGAWAGSTLVGALTLEGSSRPRIIHSAELGMTVSRSQWRGGIGRRLLRYAIDECQKAGAVSKINLQVRSDHTSAISLYLSSGFAHEGRISRGLLISGRYYDLCSMGLAI